MEPGVALELIKSRMSVKVIEKYHVRQELVSIPILFPDIQNQNGVAYKYLNLANDYYYTLYANQTPKDLVAFGLDYDVAQTYSYLIEIRSNTGYELFEHISVAQNARITNLIKGNGFEHTGAIRIRFISNDASINPDWNSIPVLFLRVSPVINNPCNTKFITAESCHCHDKCKT
jgi:hypothetical protein